MSERVIARGKIRVDARRALGKLREHLLIDLELYLCEIVRAATLGGAREVRLHWDSDDVIASFDGAGISPESLERLLDQLTGDGGERRLRLLALGVNAALGTKPELVDVYALAGERSVRVRFRPELLAHHAARPEQCHASPPPGAPETGIAVHVRKRLGWNVLRAAFAGPSHREIELLRELSSERAIPLVVRGRRLSLGDRAQALVRRSFPVFGARHASVELLAEGSGPSLELSELGVLLQRSSWLPGAGFSGVAARLSLDAEELPTNASRSAVREDARLLRDVLEAGARAYTDAIAALAAVVTGKSVPDGVELLETDPARLEHALGRVVARVADEERQGIELAAEARSLLDLPLLRDAAGFARAVSSFHRAPKVWVHSGKAPLPAELAPWLRDVLWLSGRSVEGAIAASQLADAAEIVELAKSGAERRRRLLAHPETTPTAAASSLEIARVRFDDGDLSGEVAVLTPDAACSQVRVFVENRHFVTVELEKRDAPLPMDLAIAGRELRPSFAWDDVSSEDALRQAIARALLSGLGAAAQLGVRLDSLKAPERAALALVLRCACGTLAALIERFGIAPGAAESLRRKLDELRIWPLTTGRFVSLSEMARHVSMTRALCFVQPGGAVRGAAADGRPVFAGTMTELGWLAALIGGEIERVPYDRALLAPGTSAAARHEILGQAFQLELSRLALPAEHGTAREFELGQARGLCAIAPSSAVIELHAGVALGVVPRAALLGDLLIAIDDPRTVPKSGWDGVHHRPARFWWKLERDLLGQLLGRRDPAELALPVVRSHLLQAASRLERRLAQVSAASTKRSPEIDDRMALQAELRALPFVPVLHAGGEVRLLSLAELETLHPRGASLPVIGERPGFDCADWRPVLLATASEREALQKLYPDARVAVEELEHYRMRALEQIALSSFRGKPEEDPRSVPLADPEWPAVVIDQGLDASIESIALGLPRAVAGPGGAIEAMLWRRSLGVQAAFQAIPVAARIAVREPGIVLDFRDLDESKHGAVRSSLEIAARAYLEKLVAHAAEHERGAALLSDSRFVALLSHLAPGAGAELRALVERLPWPTVQAGEAAGRTLVSEGTRVRFGRQRFASWVGRDDGLSDVDEPVLHLPQGSALEPLLVQLGYELSDVTGALAKLQARRLRSDSAPAPSLSGTAAHPSLRFSLAELGVRGAEGQVEIAPGPASEVTLIDLDGASRSIDAEVPIAIRLVARTETLGDDSRRIKTLLREISSALARQIQRLSDRFDELPPFVRAHGRRLVLTRVQSGGALPAAYARMPVLEDTAGGYWSLEAVRARTDFRYTELAPPFPERAYDPPILRLSREEATALGPTPALRRASSMITRDLGAEQRRKAAPIESLVLPLDRRERCLLVVPLSLPPTEGEVGVLLPSSADERGIDLHVERRRLRRLEDGDGWPLAALVNDDTVKPNRWFDAPQRKSERAAIVQRVRQTAMLALGERWLTLPGSRPSRRIDTTLRVSGARLHVLGALWLPATLAAPRVVVHLPNAAGPLEGALSTEPIHPAVGGALPLDGELLVGLDTGKAPSVDAVLAALGKLALDTATAICAELPETEIERWWLVLAGSPWALWAPTASGEPVSAAQVVAELKRAGKLWVSRGQGSAEGNFPEAAPPFVLAADSALVRALELRAPRLLSELGELAPSPPPDEAAEEPELPEFHDVVIDPEPAAPPRTPSALARWFDGLRQMLGLAEPRRRRPIRSRARS